MQRLVRITLVTGLLLVAAVASACSSTGKEDASSMKVWGYVASEKSAKLTVNESQLGGGELVVDRVLAPGDAWIVVHADDNGKPGMRVGLAHVKRGESTSVRVPLKNVETPKVIVAIHADKGTNKKFDFDMMKKEMSRDRPYFVNGKELAVVVQVK
jgi:hypothetical protein